MREGAVTTVLQHLTRTPVSGVGGSLLLTHTFPPRPGQRVSHVPVHPDLVQAWVACTGEPFRPHQSPALSALRRGEPVVLAGGGLSNQATLHLLICDVLLQRPGTSALLIVPDEESVALHYDELRRLSSYLSTPPEIVAPEQALVRVQGHRSIVIATPEGVHRRLLRAHDRMWRPFWQSCGLIACAGVDRLDAIAAGHLSWILLRCARLSTGNEAPLLLASAADTPDIGDLLHALTGQTWRVITIDDTPLDSVSLAVWQSDSQWQRDLRELVRMVLREDLHVNLVCSPFDRPALEPLFRDMHEHVRLSTNAMPADAHVVAGYPDNPAQLTQVMALAGRFVLLLLRDSPIERAIARRPQMLVDDPIPTPALAPPNPSIAASHLVCAANEYPLTQEEIDAWQAQELVERLARAEQLRVISGEEVLWFPHSDAEAAYESLDVRRASGMVWTYADHSGKIIAQEDSLVAQRWGFLQASVPPCRGGWRVNGRDAESLTIRLKPDTPQRDTLPLRRGRVEVRAEREKRPMGKTTIHVGRVFVEEEIFAYRESVHGQASGEPTISPTTSLRWTASACWIDLPLRMEQDGQMAGWSVVLALPLRVVARSSDVVPMVDVAQSRLYWVDTHSGGNGIASWLFQHFEDILPLAYDLALSLRGNALWENAARLDMDLLLTLLGGEIEPVAPPLLSEPRPTPVAQRTNNPAPPTRSTQPAAPASPAYPLRPVPQQELPFVAAQNNTPTQAPVQPVQAAHAASAQPPETGRPTRRFTPNRDQRRPTRSEPTVARRGHEPTREARPVRAQPPPPPQPEVAPDPAALTERARQMRIEQERTQSQATVVSRSNTLAPPTRPTLSRFRAGENVFCVPYGDGVIRDIIWDDGREWLSVEFPDFGELLIDPSVSLIRHTSSNTDTSK